MERILLAGEKLTVSKMMVKYGVGRKSISRDFEIIGEELPIMTKKGYNGGYFLIDGGENTRTHSQKSSWNVWKKSLLPVLRKIKKRYCQSHMSLDRIVGKIHKQRLPFL